MRLNCAVITAVGKLKSGNQDNFFANGIMKSSPFAFNEEYFNTSDRSENVYAVFDGMDGEECGDAASFICAKCIEGFYRVGTFSGKAMECIRTANELVCEYAREHTLDKCGSTMALVHIKDGVANFYNLGDSRIYHLTKDRFERRSVDHTNVQQLVRLGVLTSEQAKTDPRRHSLSQYVGIPTEEMAVEPCVFENVPVYDADRILICTDGLWDIVDEALIEKALRSAQNAEKTARTLCKLALDAGGKDNITVIVIEAEK